MKKALIKITLTLISFFSFGIIVPIMWEWFIVPLGVMSITFFHALGINLLIHLFMIKDADINLAIRNQEEDIKNNIMTSIVWMVMLWITFGMSAIYHMFM